MGVESVYNRECCMREIERVCVCVCEWKESSVCKCILV